jgi:VIT1/CCC1 family predicted Fe2+/Mn2+ transporter
MVLVCLKNLLFPTPRIGEREPLLDPESQQQRGHAAASTQAANSFNDKNAQPERRPWIRCRLSARLVNDATIGLSDGLTVPFALTAGLSALGTTKLVLYAGAAELIAGAISMGIGGYLGARGEAVAYFAALDETETCVADDEAKACEMLYSAFEKYNFSRETLESMSQQLKSEPDQFVDFLMKFHHGLAGADYVPSRAYKCGSTIAMGYLLGGLVPLLPYLMCDHVNVAFAWSVAVMIVALFAFGWLKTSLVGEANRWTCFKNAGQMVILGSLAAGAAMGLVVLIGGRRETEAKNHSSSSLDLLGALIG